MEVGVFLFADVGEILSWTFLKTWVKIYVDPNVPGSNDGTSWANAYNYLQDALANVSGSCVIRVAEGIYRPDENSANPTGTGNRGATFQLINGVALIGGYAGAVSPDPNARDPKM